MLVGLIHSVEGLMEQKDHPSDSREFSNRLSVDCIYTIDSPGSLACQPTLWILVRQPP